MAFEQTLLEIVVAETGKDRSYWRSKPWLTDDAAVRAADVVIIPWENFRQDKPALFPQGTGDFYRELREQLQGRSIAIAVDQVAYAEIALYADEKRLPTLFMSMVALPFVVGLLSAKVDHWLNDPTPVSVVEIEVIVENEQGKCLSIKYKGAPSGMVETISKQAERCFPKQVPHEPERPKPLAKPKPKPKPQHPQ